jgi:hypothetical protein
VSLNNACRYCKTSKQPHCKEARGFLDGYMSQVVGVLLYAINFGDVINLERDRIKFCLKSVLEIVLNDLTDSSVFGLLQISDQVRRKH